MSFDEYDRRAIEQALVDGDPENPIAIDVAEAVRSFANRLAEQAERNGRWPTQLLLMRPGTAFDDIVIRLTLQTIADELGHQIEIHWLPREMA